MGKILVVLAVIALAGCLSTGSDTGDGTGQVIQDKEEQARDVSATELAHLVDHDRNGEYGVEYPAQLCGAVGSDSYPMAREPKAFVTQNHTLIEIAVILEHGPADGFASVRVGGTYGGEEVFWSPVFKETSTFEYQLDEPMPDDNEGTQWAFFFKRTNPTTEDDPDACTSGLTAGRTYIQVFAK